MLYADVQVNESEGREIARLYMEASPEITEHARRSYREFIKQTMEQWEDVRRCVNVVFQDENPYETAADMFNDVHEHRQLRVYKTVRGEGSPLLTPYENDVFRAVHDFNGHFRSGGTFSRHGEHAAWMCHTRQYRGLARRALATETRGQNSAFIYAMDGKEFPPQKAILLPTWVSEGLPNPRAGLEEWPASLYDAG